MHLYLLLLLYGLQLAVNHTQLQKALSNHIMVKSVFMRSDVQPADSHFVVSQPAYITLSTNRNLEIHKTAEILTKT